jgi:hypothetical protein
MGLSFTTVAGPRQCSYFQIRIPRDSWPHFTVSDSRLPQSGGPGPHIYIPQEQGGPVLPPGPGFPFRHLLWLAGLWWRYADPPPHGHSTGRTTSPRCIAPVQTAQKTLFHYCVFSRCRGNNVSTELFPSNSCFAVTRLHNCYLAMDLHDTIFNTLRSTQPPIQWALGSLSLAWKWPGREADHSPPSSAEV